jgi:hypothetical protein
VNWPWHRKRHDWEIQPFDIHWNGSEASFIVHDGYELFGVSAVPNTTDLNQIRVWTRRRADQRHHKVYEIRFQSAGWGGHQVLLHLTEGWEPFGVSDSFGNHIIWFRRPA